MIGRFNLIMDSYLKPTTLRIARKVVSNPSGSANFINIPVKSEEEMEGIAQYMEEILAEKFQEEIEVITKLRDESHRLQIEAQNKLRAIKAEYMDLIRKEYPELQI